MDAETRTALRELGTLIRDESRGTRRELLAALSDLDDRVSGAEAALALHDHDDDEEDD